jgi:hypothetical protein
LAQRLRLRVKFNFPSEINADSTVHSSAQKYSALPVGQIISIPSRRPVPDRGALRGRHDSLVRDAMDAVCRKTNDMAADGEVVWACEVEPVLP